jgi:hypothetical protein
MPKIDPPYRLSPNMRITGVQWNSSGILALWLSWATGTAPDRFIGQTPLKGTKKNPVADLPGILTSYDLFDTLPILASPYTGEQIKLTDVWRQEAINVVTLEVAPGVFVYHINLVVFVNLSKFKVDRTSTEAVFTIRMPNPGGSSYEWQIKASTWKTPTRTFPAIIPGNLISGELIDELWIQQGIHNFEIRNFGAARPETVTITVQFSDLSLTGSSVIDPPED